MGSLLQDRLTKVKKIPKILSLSMRYRCSKSKRKQKSSRRKINFEETYSKALKVKRLRTN